MLNELSEKVLLGLVALLLESIIDNTLYNMEGTGPF